MSAIFTILMLLMIMQDNLVAKTGISILKNYDEILTVMLFIVALISLKKNNMTKINIKLITLSAIFMVVGFLSCYLNSRFIIKNVVMSSFLSIKFWMIIISCSLLKTDDKNLNKLYNSLFFVEKIVIVFAIFNILFVDYYKILFPVSMISYRFGFLAVCSVFVHPGKYGCFMLLCALAHLSRYYKYKNKKEIKCMIFSMITCLLSLRTKVILSAAICIGCYFIYTNSENLKKKIKKIIVASILLICFLMPFKNIINKTYTLYFTSEDGYSVRQALFDNSVKIIREYFPFGVGFGKYGSWYAAIDYSEYYFKYGMSNMYGMTTTNTSYSTDTWWPSIIGETGIIGLSIFILMLIVLLKQLIINVKKTSHMYKDISILALMVFIQTVVESFGSSSFTSPPYYFFVASIIGLSLSVNRNEKKGDIR